MPVQPFTPPPAREGWEYLRVGVDEASFRAQMEPCFRKYRLVKKCEDGSTRALTDEEIQQFERTNALKCDWLEEKSAQDLWWHTACLNLLQKLRHHKHYPVFARPVDPVNDGCADYLDLIKYPMDLGTIQARLQKGIIKDPEDFIVQVRIVFRNAYVYNKKDAAIYKMAELLSRKFEEQVEILRSAHRML